MWRGAEFVVAWCFSRAAAAVESPAAAPASLSVTHFCVCWEEFEQIRYVAYATRSQELFECTLPRSVWFGFWAVLFDFGFWVSGRPRDLAWHSCGTSEKPKNNTGDPSSSGLFVCAGDCFQPE